MQEIRVIIAGTRDFNRYELLETEAAALVDWLKSQHPDCTITIVSGGARGADLLGERFARSHKYKLVRVPADWQKYGNHAGPIRNRQMLNYAREAIGVLLAFWDGKSRGTRNMIDIAKDAGIDVHVIPVLGC